MNVGAFGCILMMKRENTYFENINDLAGLSKTTSLMALSFLVILF